MVRTLILHKDSLAVSQAIVNYSYPAKSIDFGKYSKLELFELYYGDGKNTATSTQRKTWLESNREFFNQFDFICVADAAYFKLFTKQTKADVTIGELFSSPFTLAKIAYLPPISVFKYDPEANRAKVERVLTSIIKDIDGTYEPVGSNVINKAIYPKTVEEIETVLNGLHQYPELAIDIETKGLQVTTATIYSIGFAWNKHEGTSFFVENHPAPEKIRALLKQFFMTYKGKLILFKANFDLSVIIYELFMERNFTNIQGQLEGIKYLCSNMDDALLITYLATNSCSEVSLKLKDLARSFAGDWAVDVKDVTTVDEQELLQYNLVDCLSTIYVRDTYYPIMVQDEQEQLYKEHFLPYLQDCLRMQLNGLPIDLNKVNELEQHLIQEQQEILNEIQNNSWVKDAEILIAENNAKKINAKRKTKFVTWEEVIQPFNFNSNSQLSVLMYEIMNLPVIATTDSGNPSTSSKTIDKLLKYITNEEYKTILRRLTEYADVNKILTGFIPAFKNASVDAYGNVRLTGYFNLGGTVSGRMSSNNPNLQNLPATGSRFAKAVKKCFVSSKEWLLVGIDFASLTFRRAI